MTSIRLNVNLGWLFPELCDVIRLFLGDVPISADGGDVSITCLHEETPDGNWRETAFADPEMPFVQTTPAVRGGLDEKRALKRCAKTALFRLMASREGRVPPWGSLTGIRPTRLIYEAMERGLTAEQAEKWLTDEFFVSPEKASLLGEIISMQAGIVNPPKDTFDLYIGIPFCVTRCAYCSFASGEIGDGRLTQPYVEALKREIALSADITRRLGMRLRAGYVGGGTPTAIQNEQLRDVLDSAMRAFPGATEWTVEAGRPDTIDREKLKMLKSRAVTRISVNPQTFNDETLRVIGRAHTSEDTLNAFRLAREEGFDDINMDLIAALPGETLDDFRRTLDIVAGLAPESVTVHSLAIKRSSRLHERLTVEGDAHNQLDAEGADEMIRYARRTLTALGWRPYYLYRQKYMAGNLENVGYAREGRACLYNIGNMEETARVLALGAGAITKWLFPRERRIERAPNVRNIEEYIARVDEMAARKRALILEDKSNE